MVVIMYIVLVYDIDLSGTGSTVLRHVFKECKKYLTHVQNSVFEGVLTKAQLKELEMDLKKWIRKDKDSVIVFKNNNRKWLKKDYLGVNLSDVTSNFF